VDVGAPLATLHRTIEARRALYHEKPTILYPDEPDKLVESISDVDVDYGNSGDSDFEPAGIAF
jgi:hypothetical protein